MNKKIFTLLACAFVLFSTAFTVNAKIIGGNLPVGDTVRTLSKDGNKGMYHIRIDSIYVGDVSGVTPGSSGVSETGFIPAFYSPNNPNANYFNGFLATRIDSAAGYYQSGDTLVLGINEAGKIVPVSMSDMRKRKWKTAGFLDLQTTLWCINVQDPEAAGHLPTFHFSNRATDLELGFANGNLPTFVGGAAGEDATYGWMYSYSYENGQLNYSRPLYSRIANSNDTYRVLVWRHFPPARDNGSRITARDTTISSFLAQTIPGMIKVTIVEAAPIVLDVEAFNTKFGYSYADGPITLKFDKNSTTRNPFSELLYAVQSPSLKADSLGYIRVRMGSDAGHFIYNGASDYYNNTGTSSTKYIALKSAATIPSGANADYRFVFFPSSDSLVINAYAVTHSGHSHYGTGTFRDSSNLPSSAAPSEPYLGDNSLPYPIYYGLYNRTIHDALIVRLQDLYEGGETVMTIGQYPSNVHISMETDCQALQTNVFKIDQGVYTIWDNRGRILGVRIYNGSLAPQWFKPDDGECPDRIPSYQWVVENNPAPGTIGNSLLQNRVSITNREFGDIIQNNQRALQFTNVLLLKDDLRQIFKGQTQFLYGPLMQNAPAYYDQIHEAWVGGRYIDTISVSGCDDGPVGNLSGFRPVNRNYLANPFLGYKHFPVVKSDIGKGSSDNTKDSLGMDHNAFSFNYYHDYGLNWYIQQDSENFYGDAILKVGDEAKRAGFLFELPIELWDDYEEELYGYPTGGASGTASSSYSIKYHPDKPAYTQTAPRLRRYYYQLKIADFYSFRDGLAEQYVVLKGAKSDGSDVRNALKYGLADYYGIEDPFKFANVYLRDTYFFKVDGLNRYEEGEELLGPDKTRRTYYTILDRIHEAQIDRIGEMGVEVSDELAGPDGSYKYNLVTWSVDENNSTIKAQGKTVSSVRVSPFALRSMNYELYRRLNSIRDDSAKVAGDYVNVDGAGRADRGLDEPRVLRIHRQLNKAEYLYEDALSAVSYNNRTHINYLGSSNRFQNPEDETGKYNYNLFIDTAYINRGTGYIKPQYLIAVGNKSVDSLFNIREVPNNSNPCCGSSTVIDTIPAYIYARYLINATDSARGAGSSGLYSETIINRDYVYDLWDRFIFVPAIHANDRLYLLREVERKADIPYVIEIDSPVVEGSEGIYYNVRALEDMVKRGVLKERTKESKGLGDFYDFKNWSNYHNDVTFSFRFTIPEAKNADRITGIDRDGVSNDMKRFFIESETTNRTPAGNNKIAPTLGGWIKLNNGVATISRTSYQDAINLADMFNIDNILPTVTKGKATPNPDIKGGINVIAGVESVSILNAGGKRVTISNLLGQTVVKTVLSSDNATIKAPKGVVVVQIEGEKAVKAVIK